MVTDGGGRAVGRAMGRWREPGWVRGWWLRRGGWAGEGAASPVPVLAGVLGVSIQGGPGLQGREPWAVGVPGALLVPPPPVLAGPVDPSVPGRSAALLRGVANVVRRPLLRPGPRGGGCRSATASSSSHIRGKVPRPQPRGRWR